MPYESNDHKAIIRAIAAEVAMFVEVALTDVLQRILDWAKLRRGRARKPSQSH